MPFDNETYRPIPEGHRRLLVLAEFLETRVGAFQFDLGTWTNSPQTDVSCGTRACAVGWATAIPSLRTEGLRLALTPCWWSPSQKDIEPVFKELAGWEAVCEFFGLSGTEAENLFAEESYSDIDEPTDDPFVVADRIRAFVAEQAKVLA